MANSPARSAIDVGTVIDDTYTIEALIGRGGMGAVFLASHLRLPGKKVAIKVLHADLTQDEVLARFKREAEIASQLGHPNIVEVHDSNHLPDGTPYLVLEYLEGENLAQRIARGPIPVEETLTMARQIAAALAAAHREGIVHRDLKPQNVFLVPTEVGGNVVEQVKVLDFGISKMLRSQTVKTQASALLGTPQYMAPEQATGKHDEVDERTDIFALGSMIYEMLCGQPAFTGASVPEVVFKVVYEEAISLAERVPGLDPAIVAAVHKAMEKNQVDRFRTVGDFIEALTGRPTSLIRPPRRSGGVVGAKADTNPSNPTNVSSEDALAKTVGSGDHGAAPIAVADTLASGDHKDSKQAIEARATMATGADPRAPAAPVVAPTPAPGTTRRWILIGAGALATVVVIAVVARRMMHHRKQPPRVVATTTADAAPPTPTPTPATIDAAPVEVIDAAPVGPVVDAAPAARADARGPRAKPDASGAGATTTTDTPPNPEADATYDKGVAALAKKPERTREMGYRLRDQYDDPRGWLLIGAASCPLKDTPSWVQAKKALKTNGPLLRKLYDFCRNNMPVE